MFNKKEYNKAYRQTTKGKLARKKYRESEKYKLYCQSEKYKEYQKKYRQSDKGKLAQKRYYEKRKTIKNVRQERI